MPSHEHFEELCALAVVGELPPAEYPEFEQHLSSCSLCREALGGMAELTDTWMPGHAQFSDGLRSLRLGSTRSLRERFVAKARNQGIKLSRQSEAKPGFWVQLRLPNVRIYLSATAALACAMSVGFILIHVEHRTSRLAQENRDLQKNVSVLQGENFALKGKIAGTLLTQQKASESSASELAKLREQYATALARIISLEGTFTAVATNRDEVQAQLDKARADLVHITEGNSAVSRELANTRSELESARNAILDNKAALLAQNKKIEGLSQRPSVENANLERERQLLAADRDIRDLMGARNLHIIDVHDRDSKGKARRSFGRVFYTEGKSLIFYAFDLSDPNLKNASFQAWGHKEDGSRKEVSLGLFFMDDKQQSRWVLRFNDPAVLAEIDSVFVTVEPPGGRTAPSGNKFLYAYLNLNANHP